MPHAPIERYGIIGDLHTVALVGTGWLHRLHVLPAFDSPSIFARAARRRARRQLPASHRSLDGARQKQLYLPDTNILLTRFLSGDGVAEISDFMPVERAGMRTTWCGG